MSGTQCEHQTTSKNNMADTTVLWPFCGLPRSTMQSCEMGNGPQTKWLCDVCANRKCWKIHFQQTIMNKNLTVMATYKTLSKDWRKEVASFEDCISLWHQQVSLQAIYPMVICNMTQPSGDIWLIYYHYTNEHCIWGTRHNCHQTRQALCQNTTWCPKVQPDRRLKTYICLL